MPKNHPNYWTGQTRKLSVGTSAVFLMNHTVRPITESTGGVVGCCNVNVLTELTRKVDVLQRNVNHLKELTELTKKSNQTATCSTKKS